MSSPRSSIADNAVDGDKRRSGRVSRRPDIFAPPSTNNAKRKRAQIDQEAGAEENEDEDGDLESGSDNQDDAESEIEIAHPRKQPAKRTGPAPKKSKPNAKAAAPTALKRSRKRARNVDRDDAEHSTGLYADVFSRGGSIETAVAQWIQAFHRHEATALADLINFCLRCAGCELEIDHHDIADPDACTNKISDLQDEFQAQNVTEYPIISKAKGTSAFRESMTDFFQTLIKATQDHGILFQRIELMENLARWLTGMTVAQNRPFRHTATVVALTIVTALTQIGRDLRNASAQALRHSESEKKNRRVNKDRVNAIRKEATDAQEKLQLLDNILEDWFNTVFLHRYRDIDHHIRIDCASALGEWTVTYPDVFFDDSHLRYLAWVLSDSHPMARVEVLKQLLRLYKTKDRLTALKTFTDRFRARIIEIATLDTDHNARIEAIKILDVLREAGYLEASNIDDIGKLIFDADSRIRSAVTTFFTESTKEALAERIEDLGGQEVLDEELPESTGPMSPSVDWLHLKCLTEMLVAYDSADSESSTRHVYSDCDVRLHAAPAESRCAVAAEVLYSEIGIIQDWESIAGYLLYDSSNDAMSPGTDGILVQLRAGIKLDAPEEIVLAQVLYMSVILKMASLSDDTSANKHKKGKKTKKQREEMADDKESTQRHLANLLPRLLKRYDDVPSIVAIVLRLDREVIDTSFERVSSTYAAYLSDVKKQFLTHTDEHVLDEVSSALLRAKDNQDLSDVAEEQIDELWQELTSKLTGPSGRDLTVRGNMSANATLALATDVSRLRRLATISRALTHLEEKRSEDDKSPLEYLIDCVSRGEGVESSKRTENAELARADDALCLQAAGTVMFYFLWTTAEWTKAMMAGNTTMIEDQLSRVAEYRDAFDAALTGVLSSRSSRETVSASISGHILDLHTTLATLRQIEVREGTHPDYLALVFELNADVAERILQVFGASEAKFAKLTHKTIDRDTKAKAKKHRTRQERPVDADPIDEDEDEAEEQPDPEASDEEPSESGESDDQTEDDDAEAGDEEQEAAKTTKRRIAVLRRRLLAEQRLCELTGKIVFALLAGMFQSVAVVRKRLERNQSKLGPSYKGVVKWLADVGASTKAKKSKTVDAGKTKPVKSREIVVESDDDDDVDEAQSTDEEEHDDVDDEAQEGAAVQVDGEVEDEIESVIGD